VSDGSRKSLRDNILRKRGTIAALKNHALANFARHTLTRITKQ
jgi:hypothetical protein